ncbi:Hsp20/alpha crystallin family protein [Ancylobacter dichloromethanicus]|uniref:Heat-shock protein Hsp20 n=1 Tax=Ancylobacter dichloromethanicus TaxID=518825 RepID=A0A9W6JAK6_9HYPH|nr:Hsp20/alpha crystallin family protein [Ancylobacter dichloromethanicus]MBS7552244.1 Hsp20/alpha crystallin family protein [Ancylobacter dichloromethanicus]GLK73980.1 heat-shock protein Hsp20 [Ancylobacter dichloromethanicus]
MKKTDPRLWMWSDAVDMLNRAERMHRQMFQPAQRAEAPARHRAPCWEPPVDMLETERELLVLAALPGVDPDRMTVSIQNGVLTIAGERVLPPELRRATIHRMELPQGRFERQLALPPGRYDVAHPRVVNGCLAIVLRKV